MRYDFKLKMDKDRLYTDARGQEFISTGWSTDMLCSLHTCYDFFPSFLIVRVYFEINRSELVQNKRNYYWEEGTKSHTL